MTKAAFYLLKMSFKSVCLLITLHIIHKVSLYKLNVFKQKLIYQFFIVYLHYICINSWKTYFGFEKK